MVEYASLSNIPRVTVRVGAENQSARSAVSVPKGEGTFQTVSRSGLRRSFRRAQRQVREVALEELDRLPLGRFQPCSRRRRSDY